MATIRQPFGAGADNQTPLTSANVGTVATGVTAVENGDAQHHKTTLTVSKALGNIPGGADLALGTLLYTLPAGVCNVKLTHMSVSVQQQDGNIDADTPDGGIGTTLANGVVAVLGGTAAFENMLTGQTFDDCDGTAELQTLATSLVVKAADNHTVYFNIADGWAASGDAGAVVAGTVIIEWDFIV